MLDEPIFGDINNTPVFTVWSNNKVGIVKNNPTFLIGWRCLYNCFCTIASVHTDGLPPIGPSKDYCKIPLKFDISDIEMNTPSLIQLREGIGHDEH